MKKLLPLFFFVLITAGLVIAQNYAFPTQSPGDNSTKPASTAYADAAATTAASAASTFAWGGNGSDGAITADGTTTLTCLGAPSSTIYTMTKDCFFTTLVVNTNTTIKTANFAIFAKVSVTVNGTIHNNGAIGTSGSPGISSSGASGGAA